MFAVDDLTRIQSLKRSSLALRNQSTGELHELSGEMLVGREVECDIQLDSLQISRYHAKVYVSSSGVYIEDLKSFNGTFVNGRQIQRRTHVSLGDLICFDDLEFRVTTTRSGNAGDTRLATSQNFSQDRVAEIRQGSKNNQPSAHGAEKGLPTDSLKPTLKMPPEQQPVADALKSEEDQGKQPKVHQMPNMQAFLEYAGSGLKAQEPLPHEEANPFRLMRSKHHQFQAQKFEQKLPNELPSDEATPSNPEVPAETPVSVPLKPGSPQASRQVEGESSSKLKDDEGTKYLSLNAMDSYVATNEKYQKDLQVGSGPRLIAMTAPIRGKVFKLASIEDVKCWSVGRDDAADVCLRDPAVSREHAWVTKLDALYQLRVNESASDILVNGKTCTEANLRHGDRLQFGAMELVFKLDEQSSVLPAKPKKRGWWASIMRGFGAD